jgi:[ribosomal protein S5]-alanine N-acetyltransferase
MMDDCGMEKEKEEQKETHKRRPPFTSPELPPLSTKLETARMVLRPPRPSDLPELRAHLRRSAAHLRPWSPAPRGSDDPASITSLSKTVLRQRKEWKQGQAFALLMFAKIGQERIMGRVTLGSVVRGVFQNSYLGYEVDVDDAGRGVATEGVSIVVDFAFDVLKLHRVQAAIMPSNVRSLRVAEKLGFRREGFAERYLCIADAWEDHVIVARTYEDWARDRASETAELSESLAGGA